MSERYFEEFLYRGRPSQSPQPAGWRIVIAEADAEGRVVPGTLRALSMEQAAELGIDLPEAIAGINTDALRQIERLTGEKERLLMELAKARGMLTALQRDVARIQAAVKGEQPAKEEPHAEAS